MCADGARTVAPNEESMNNLVKELQDEGFDLEMEGDFAECPGIRMEHRDDRTICMTQKGSIKKTVATAKMKERNPNKTPASTAALGSDAKGKHWDQHHWDCARIVGMLLHASNNTRPDVTFTASQVAQCTAHPKEPHARAVKCIMHCSAGTANKGIIMKHDRTFNLKVWADSNFAGTSGQEPSGSAKSVKS